MMPPAVTAARADQHLVVDDERRHRDRVVIGRIGDAGAPLELPADRIDGDQMRVDGAHEQGLAVDGETAVDHAATGARLGRVLVGEGPEHAPGRRIERDDVVRCLHGVENPVDDERRRLELLERARLPDPLQLEPGDVVARDLVEQAVALVVVGGGVVEPVFGLVGGVFQPLESDLGCGGTGEPDGGEEG